MKKIVFSLALVAAAAASHAQVYVQGNLGSANASESGGNSASSSSLGAGVGYQINPNFAVDALYQKLYKEPGIKSNAFSVRAIGIYPLNDKVSFNGKLGFGSTKFDDGVDSAKGNLTYGIGMDFAASKQVSLGLDIDLYKTKENANWAAIKQTNVSLNLKYRF